MFGSPPPCRAAMMIARLSLLNSLPRLASMAPFLCLMVAQWECPDMARPPQSGVFSSYACERLPAGKQVAVYYHRTFREKRNTEIPSAAGLSLEQFQLA